MFLQNLDLSENKIGDIGAQYLADALRENTVNKIEYYDIFQ